MDSAHLGTWMSLLYIIAALGWVVGCHMLWTSSTFCPHSKKCPTPHPSLLSLLFPHFSSMLPVHFYLNSDSPFANNYLIVRRSMRWRRLQASLLRLHSDQISWYLSPIGDIFQDPSWHIVPKTALISTQLTYMLFLPYTHIFINLHLFIKETLCSFVASQVQYHDLHLRVLLSTVRYLIIHTVVSAIWWHLSEKWDLNKWLTERQLHILWAGWSETAWDFFVLTQGGMQFKTYELFLESSI